MIESLRRVEGLTRVLLTMRGQLLHDLHENRVRMRHFAIGDSLQNLVETTDALERFSHKVGLSLLNWRVPDQCVALAIIMERKGKLF